MLHLAYRMVICLTGVASLAVAAEPGARRETWLDAARQREVPVKIYLPAALAPEAPAPVVIVSHGLGGSREGYAYLGQHWAGRGFVAIHLQHAGSDESIWRSPDGRPRPDALQRMRDAASAEQLRARLADVAFVLDELQRIQRSDRAHPLKQTIDMARIAFAGHSFGAVVGQHQAGQLARVGGRDRVARDERIKTVVLLSPSPPRVGGAEAFKQIAVPVLHLTGTADADPFGNFKPADRQMPYQSTTADDQYLVVFDGATHMTFGGPSERSRRQGRAKDAVDQAMVQKVSTAFLEAYLRDDPAARAWLRDKASDELAPGATLHWK